MIVPGVAFDLRTANSPKLAALPASVRAMSVESHMPGIKQRKGADERHTYYVIAGAERKRATTGIIHHESIALSNSITYHSIEDRDSPLLPLSSFTFPYRGLIFEL